jgi:hypothetical protein
MPRMAPSAIPSPHPRPFEFVTRPPNVPKTTPHTNNPKIKLTFCPSARSNRDRSGSRIGREAIQPLRRSTPNQRQAAAGPRSVRGYGVDDEPRQRQTCGVHQRHRSRRDRRGNASPAGTRWAERFPAKTGLSQCPLDVGLAVTGVAVLIFGVVLSDVARVVTPRRALDCGDPSCWAAVGIQQVARAHRPAHPSISLAASRSAVASSRAWSLLSSSSFPPRFTCGD